MNKKYFTLVLHGHIPYVLSHGTWPHGVDWLYEAAAECYMPLLEVFEGLAAEGSDASLNFSFTPVLAEQLADPRFKEGFDKYLAMKTDIARNDLSLMQKDGSHLAGLALRWLGIYEKLREDFNGRYGRDLLHAFRALEDRGVIEIMTSGATHGYFPLLSEDASIRQQVGQGRHSHRMNFGRDPRGFWLPECAFRPGYVWTGPFGGKPAARKGVDELLAEAGLGYFFVDTHLLKGGEVQGLYNDRFPGLRANWDKQVKEHQAVAPSEKDIYSPYLVGPSMTAFFVRDDVSAEQVWSRSGGYPGDGAYLEFHKKHFPGGMRYWRITSAEAGLGDKMPYDPEAAEVRARVHAEHFAAGLARTLAGREDGTITAMFDAELFGHWWFEGPEWISHVLKALAGNGIRAVSAGKRLDEKPPETVMSLPEGSWGQGGSHWVWLNEDTSWIWRKIYEIEAAAARIASLPAPGPDIRLLRQFYREKFLLESSDWPFLVTTRTARDYAETRAAGHFERVERIASWIVSGQPLAVEDQALLSRYESEDRLFKEVVLPDGRVI